MSGTGSATDTGTHKFKLVLATVTILALAVTSYWTKKPTPIDLVTVSSSITFRTGAEPIEIPPFIAESLTVLGDGTIVGLPVAGTFQSSLTIERADKALALSVQGLRVGAGAVVTFRKIAAEPRLLELVLKNESQDQTTITAFTRDRFSVSGAEPALSKPFDDRVPRAIRITSNGDTLVLRIRMAEKLWTTLRPFEIIAVSFLDADPTNPVPDIFSAVESGTLTFVEIGSITGSNREIRLRPGQFLHVGDLSRGFVRNLAFEDDKLSIGIAAEVGELETRWRDFKQDHMPSWLAYLTSLDGVKEILGSFAGLLLIAMELHASRRNSK